MKAQFEADMLNVNRDLEKLRREKVMWEMTKQTGDQRGAASTCDEQVGVKKINCDVKHCMSAHPPVLLPFPNIKQTLFFSLAIMYACLDPF